jgi:hypothetical protein
MAEDPDLERRLEAMFHSARPRRGFEEDLWQKIDANRPWHQRLGRRFRPAVRYAPALATILVVSLGITWLAGNFHAGGSPSSGSSTTSAGAPAYSGGEKAAAPAFGVLPRLATGAQPSLAAPQASAANADATAGLSFSGTLPSLSTELPVYRYDEPTADDRARIDAALQAQSGLAAIAVTPSDAARGLEPQFVFNAPGPSGPQGGVAQAANAFLAAHNLVPRFAFQLSQASSGNQVIYGRVFDGPAGPIRQVRPDGGVAGLTIDITGGTVSGRGPLVLPLTTASYPARTAADALTAAHVRKGSGAAALDHAEVVYVLVVAGGHGYYEPELLLTGPGLSVLAPVVAQAWLSA